MTPAGVVTNLHVFGNHDGADPVSELIQLKNGDLAGTAQAGGDSSDYNGVGTVYEITLGGQFSTLYAFGGQNSSRLNGIYPRGGLLEGPGGEIYGTTSALGEYFAGTAFQLTKQVQTISFPFIPDHLATDGPFNTKAVSSTYLGLFYTVTGPATISGNVVTLTGSGLVSSPSTSRVIPAPKPHGPSPGPSTSPRPLSS